MISDTQVTHYPLGEAAAHLTGYVQNVTAEDLEEHEGEGYTAASVRHGQDVRLTIDAELQREIYEQFREDKSCSAAINPYTGEVLALVSMTEDVKDRGGLYKKRLHFVLFPCIIGADKS